MDAASATKWHRTRWNAKISHPKGRCHIVADWEQPLRTAHKLLPIRLWQAGWTCISPYSPSSQPVASSLCGASRPRNLFFLFEKKIFTALSVFSFGPANGLKPGCPLLSWRLQSRWVCPMGFATIASKDAAIRRYRKARIRSRWLRHSRYYPAIRQTR